MLHKYSLPARWFRFFAGRSQHNTHSAPPPASASPAAAGRASQPRRPVPLPGTEDFWLALAACYLPESVRPLLEDGLRQSVRARACWGQTGTPWPDERPNEPPEWRRFGIYGEQLVPKPWLEMQRLLIKELKRTVHTLEASGLSRLERSWRLLLHGARLGQLYADLARRSDARAALEALRQTLAALLA